MKNVRTNAYLVIAAATAAAPAAAQQVRSPAQASAPALESRLPIDAAVKIGTLPNGIRYYIRKNVKPEKRAELRLVVNAGSILETDNELGLAHFIEHTAFNGTTHFAKNDLVKYLQSIGVKFGADLNAYTSFDETVYILPVPTDTAQIVDKAFGILEDWARGQVFDSAEVVNERGVVREEWRGRKGASDRMLQQWLPIAFKDSRYATRLPIGNERSIMAATPARLRGFYDRWYRPDLMAVVAVGDFSPVEIESLIRQHFSGIKAKPDAPKRMDATVPGNAAPLIAIATDKEATSSSVNLIFKVPAVPTKTVGDYRRDLIERLYLGMLNSRLDEISQKPDAPFLGAGGSKGGFFARNIAAFTLVAEVKDGGIDRGLEALLTETKRVDQFGFLSSELDREKQDIVRGYERAYAERDKTQSASFVSEYVGNYLQGESIPGIEYEYAVVQQLMPGITLDEVNHLASTWITDENRVIIALAPEKEGLTAPTRGDILAAFDRAAKAQVVAYAENLSGNALVDPIPAPGRIVAERPIPGVGVSEWTLSNGARVLVKPTDFKADEVVFGAYSMGGTSLASNDDYMSAVFASDIAGLSGLGDFNLVDLGKKLSGKAAGVRPAIGGMTEGLSGRASPKDIETLFQLAYLNMTAPRFDSAAYGAFKNQAASFLANRGASPEAVFGDTVGVTMSQHDFRSRPLSAATFAEVDPTKALAFYRDRFADAGDFTFVFVGNVDTTALKPLVERYLASLPTTGRKETWRNVTPGAPRGVIERVVRKGTEPKANTIMLFTGACEYVPETRFAMRALAEYFQIKATETLREELGGTYSPSVGGGCSRIPRQEYSISVSFGSSPDNVEKLSRSVLGLIDTLKAQGPSVADVEKIREQLIRGREVELKQNSYWLNNIMGREQAGEDLAGFLAPYDEMIKKLTPGQIQEAAKRYFDTKNYARFVLLPEAGMPTP
jgi:zinc protease